MNTKHVIFIVAVVTLVACSHGTKPGTGPAPAISQTLGGVEMNKRQDGLSFETAIKLEAKTQAEGVAAQHAWIKNNLPGSHPAPTPPPPKLEPGEEAISFGQEMIQRDGKLYSVVHLEMPDGKPRDVHFDITGYFGK